MKRRVIGFSIVGVGCFLLAFIFGWWAVALSVAIWAGWLLCQKRRSAEREKRSADKG